MQSKLEFKIMADDELGKFYIDHHRVLSPLAQKELLKTPNSFLCEFYTKYGCFWYHEEKLLFLKTAPDALIDIFLRRNAIEDVVVGTLIERDLKWLSVCAQYDRLPHRFESDFIKLASNEELVNYFQTHAFCRKGCLALLEHCDRDTVQKYISLHPLFGYEYDDRDADAKLIQLGDVELIKEYIDLYADKISEEGELALLQLENADLIKFYIDRASFSDSAVAKLIHTGNDEIFKYYVERVSFSLNSLCSLMQSENMERIGFYIEHHKLPFEAEFMFMRVATKELIEKYNKK